MRPARHVRHPDGFHGASALAGRRGAFFEGWYVKLLSADLGTRLAVIPGVFLSADRSVAEAFIQVLDGASGATAYHRFELSAFRADARRFDVRIAGSTFSEDGVVLDLPGLRGRVEIVPPLARWPVTLRSPGIMGWYAWLPTMECYHGVVSLDHALAGTIERDGATTHLTGGRGYIEKDWGQAFPAGYVWMQSNTFPEVGVSLVASTALIPWRGSAFRGFIAGVMLPAGHPAAGLHRFATYDGSRTVRLVVGDRQVEWTLRGRGGQLLVLRADIAAGVTGLLHAPVRTQMHQRVAETLDGRIEVQLVAATGRVLFEGTGMAAGIEVHGDIDRLLATGP